MEKLSIINNIPEFKYNNWNKNIYEDYISYCGKEEKEEFVKLQSNNSLDKIIKSCALESLKKVITNKFNLYWTDFLENEEVVKMYPIFKDIEIINNKKDKTEFVFITVNPRPDVSLKIFMDTIQKAISKVWIERYIYVIEQRGENEEELGKGIHTHILLYKGKKKLSELHREMGNTFKKIVDTSNYALFNISGCKDEDIDKRKNYMLGIKNDENKHLKQKMDVIYRLRNNIETSYQKWGIN